MNKFLKWYNKHEDYLKYFLGNYIYVNGNFSNLEDVKQTIDDVIQDMFEDIFKKEYSDENIGSLMITIAQHYAIKELRRRDVRKAISLDALKEKDDNYKKSGHILDALYKKAIEFDSWAVGRDLQPDEYAEKNELKEIIRNEINRISKDGKNYKIFLLKSEGYTFKEISDELGLSRQRCIDRMFFIRKKFKENKKLINY